MVVRCHQTGDEAIVSWTPHSKAKERYRELNGKVLDNKGEVQYILHGAWDKGMTRRRPGGWGKWVWLCWLHIHTVEPTFLKLGHLFNQDTVQGPH